MKPCAALAHRLEVAGPGDVGDPAASQPDQMLDGEPAAAAVVGQQAERPRIGDLGEGVDDRHRRVGADRAATAVGAAAGDDDAVDALGQQGIDVLALADRVVARVHRKTEMRAALEGVLDAFEQREC